MYDVTNLIFPMTAGDLVESAVVLGVQIRGDGPEMHMFRVKSVEVVDEHEFAKMLKIVFRDQHDFTILETVLKDTTPLLVTDIRRS